MDDLKELAAFMAEYAAFMEELAGEEIVKFDAITSFDREKMEQSIARQQANARRLETMEERRQTLQQNAGFDNFTLRQIADAVGGETGASLEKSWASLSASAAQVQEFNRKSLELVRENLDFLHQHEPAAVSGPRGYTPDKKRDERGGASLFTSKI